MSIRSWNDAIYAYDNYQDLLTRIHLILQKHQLTGQFTPKPHTYFHIDQIHEDGITIGFYTRETDTEDLIGIGSGFTNGLTRIDQHTITAHELGVEDDDQILADPHDYPKDP